MKKENILKPLGKIHGKKYVSLKMTRVCKSNIHKQLTLKYNSNFCIQVHLGMCRSFLSLLLCTIGILGSKMLPKWNSYANSVKIYDKIEVSGDSLLIANLHTIPKLLFRYNIYVRTSCNTKL